MKVTFVVLLVLSIPILLAVLVLASLLRQRWRTRSLKNVPGPPSLSFWTGVLQQFFDATDAGWSFHKHISETYGAVVRITGVLGDNQLYISDPKALHQILVKEGDVYEETDAYVEGNRLLFGEGILASLGDRHRRQRKMLSPIFAPAHLRTMVPIFFEVAEKLKSAFSTIVISGAKEIDVLAWTTRFSLETIGRAGLGYSFDPLASDVAPHPYSQASKKLVPLACESMILRNILMPVVVRLGYKARRLSKFLVGQIPSKQIQQIKDIVEVLDRTSVEIYKAKRGALLQNEIDGTDAGTDIISILMKANLTASESDHLSETELIGQITSLTFAATDTTSGILAHILHLLAEHPEVQHRVRREIADVRCRNGDLQPGYDELLSLPYLDAICRETLRMYPPVSVNQRIARQDTFLPLSTPLKDVDGRELERLFIPCGTEIHVSMLAINRDPHLWGSDSYIWRPERWLEPLPENVMKAQIPGVYSHLLTFLGGNRSCIGFKFAELVMKVGVLTLIESLQFDTSKKIFWQRNIIMTPNTDPTGTHPTLPLKVSVL